MDYLSVSSFIMPTVSIQRAHGVSVQPSLTIDTSTSIDISWNPNDIFPNIEDPDSFSVDIHAYAYDFSKSKWVKITIYKPKNLPNSGQASITLFSLPRNLRNILSAAIIHVTVGKAHSSSSNKDLIKKIHDQMETIPFPHRVGIWSGILFVTHGNKGRGGKSKFEQQCLEWRQKCSKRRDSINLREVLPPCPPTLDRVRLPNSGLEEMRFDSSLFTSNNYHSQLIDLVHPGVSECFVQAIVPRCV